MGLDSSSDPAATPPPGAGMSAPGGPLHGLQVVEIAGLGPTPFAALLLAELGADVVRIDRPPTGAASVVGTSSLDRSRPSVAIDLKVPAGLETALSLIDRADILLEGLRPGVAERLGLGPEVTMARNPRLIYGRMTGWGQHGPWAHTAGHDINYAALSGALHLCGPAERPIPPANLVADFGGGALYLVVGVLAAVHSRGLTGQGQVIDAAMIDGAASLTTMLFGMLGEGLWQDRRESNLLDGGAPFYTTYECADGAHLAVGCIEPKFFDEFTALLDVELPGGQAAMPRWPEHREILAARFREHPRDHWEGVFEGSDACVTPVLSLAQAPHHPHVRARGTFVDGPTGPIPRIAPRFSQTPTREPTPPRPAGADTITYLLSQGFTRERVGELLAHGAIVDGGREGRPAG